MTTSCQSCNEPLDVDESSLPPAGRIVKCPHCGAPVRVRPPHRFARADGAATANPGRPAEVLDDLLAPRGYFDPELPAPKRTPGAAMFKPLDEKGGPAAIPDLLTPVERRAAPPAETLSLDVQAQLPAPVMGDLRRGLAPVGPSSARGVEAASRAAAPPMRLPNRDIADRVLTPPPPTGSPAASDPNIANLPSLRGDSSGAFKLRAQVLDSLDLGAALPGLDELTDDDFSRAPARSGSSVDLVVPRNFRAGGAAAIPNLPDDAPDLVKPKSLRGPERPQMIPVRVSEPSGDEDETPLPPLMPPGGLASTDLLIDDDDLLPPLPPRAAPAADGAERAPLELLDLSPSGPPSAPGPTAAPDEAARPPNQQPAAVAVAPTAPAAAPAPAAATTTASPLAPPVTSSTSSAAARVQTPPRLARIAIMAGGGAAVLALALGAVLLVTDLPSRGKRREDAARALASARVLFSDDTVASYRKAAALLREIAATQPKAQLPRALQAQAHLAVALVGFSAETRFAERQLAELAPEPSPADLIEIEKARALKLLVDGKAGDAEALLRLVLRKQGNDVSALVYLGWAQMASGDAHKALETFKLALAADPERPQALYGCARAEEQLQNTVGGAALVASAIEHDRKALQLSPNHLGAAIALERLQTADPASSEKRIRELLDKSGTGSGPRELAEAWSLLGARAQQGGRLVDAEEQYRKALAIYPAVSAPKLGLAHVLAALHRGKEALLIIDPVVKAEPRNGAALLVLAEAQLEAGDLGGATRSLAAAEKLVPRSGVAALRGRLEESRGVAIADERAVVFYREAVAADPRAVEPAMALSRLLARSGHTDEARGVLSEVEAQASSDPALRDRLGEAYLATGSLEKAEAAFRDVIQRAPDALLPRFHLGETLVRQGRLDDAAALYANLAASQKDAPGLAQRRAKLALLRGHVDEAVTLYGDALSSDAHPPAVLRASAGLAYLLAGRNEEARRQLDFALASDERIEAAHRGLAQLAIIAKRFEDAESEARRAIALGGSPEAHLALAQAEEGLGHLSEARAEYLVAAGVGGTVGPEQVETSVAARIGAARMLIRNGAVKDGLVEAQGIVKDQPERAEPYILVGDCAEELNQADKAHKAYEAALKKNPASAEAAFKLARADADAGKDKVAVQLLDRALSHGADTASFAPDALLLAGDLHRRLHQHAAAMSAYRAYLTVAGPGAPERKVAQEAITALESGAE